MISVHKDTRVFFLILVASLVLYMQGLSLHGVEYRDDEIFYFKSTQEMFEEKNFLSPTYFGQDRFQKPILYYWFILFCYQIFGVNWFAARMTAVLFAGLSVALTWKTAKRLFDGQVAALSCVILMTVPLFFRHAKNAVPDMPLNFFIVWAVYCAILFADNPQRKKEKYFFFFACACGFMVKGFAALAVPIFTLVGYSLWTKRQDILVKINFSAGLILMALLILPWFVYMSVSHGQEYTQYMLVHETQNRVVSGESAPLIINILTSFGRNVIFYLNVLFNYFAPWCLFLVGSLPFAFLQLKRKGEEAPGLYWMLTWFCVVFLFFSFVHMTMSHYILVLSTPFAILTAYFFREGCAWLGKGYVFVKAVIILLLAVSFAALAFLHIFLAGGHAFWLAVYIIGFIFLLRVVNSSQSTVTAPFILGLFIIFALFNNKMMIDAGITAHSVLQRFAATISHEMDGDALIGVGSHDLHEKEFQVYFDKRLKKAATDEDDVTRTMLNSLFVNKEEVYCLILEQDYNKFKKTIDLYQPIVIQEELIFRKRLSLDGKFALALIRLDRSAIAGYLMEKVVLLRKDRIS